MDKMQNFVVGYVVTAPDPATTGTSLTVSNGSLFPDPATFGAYNLVCWSMDNIQTPTNCEIVRVTAKSTSGSNAVLTITRGQEGTSGLSIAAGWRVYLSVTQKYFDDLATALSGKQDSLGYTAENTGNKVTSISGSSTDTQYPSAKLVYDQLALKASLTGAETLTNKRITKRVGTATTAPDVSGTYTLTVDSDSYDEYSLTAQANAFTVAAPTGTPVAGQKLILRFNDNGTARAITWNAAFRAGDLALPTTTVISKTMYIGFEWNATDSKWDLLASQGGF